MAPKQLPDDFKEFIQCINKHRFQNKRASRAHGELADVVFAVYAGLRSEVS